MSLSVRQWGTNDMLHLPRDTVIHPVFFVTVEGKTLWAHSISKSLCEMLVHLLFVLKLLDSCHKDANSGNLLCTWNLKGLLILLRSWLEIKTLVLRLWRGQGFCFSSQNRCQRPFAPMARWQFFSTKYTTHGEKKLNLNNLNHFLTFVPTLNHSGWAPQQSEGIWIISLGSVRQQTSLPVHK